MQVQGYRTLINVFKFIDANTVDHQVEGAKIIKMAFAAKKSALRVAA
jgi:hypothetical protein